MEMRQSRDDDGGHARKHEPLNWERPGAKGDAAGEVSS